MGDQLREAESVIREQGETLDTLAEILGCGPDVEPAELIETAKRIVRDSGREA